MYENIFFCIISINEAITIPDIKPFNCTLHLFSYKKPEQTVNVPSSSFYLDHIILIPFFLLHVGHELSKLIEVYIISFKTLLKTTSKRRKVLEKFVYWDLDEAVHK